MNFQPTLVLHYQSCYQNTLQNEILIPLILKIDITECWLHIHVDIGQSVPFPQTLTALYMYVSFIQEIDYKTIMQAGYTTVLFVLDFSSYETGEIPVIFQMKQMHKPDVVRTKIKFCTRFESGSPQR